MLLFTQNLLRIASGCLSIFAIACATMVRASPTFSTVYSFGTSDNADGDDPNGSLIQASDGNLYGVTALGGSSNQGTIYKISPSGSESTLYSFSGWDGDQPIGALVQAEDGKLYGSAYFGGYDWLGTLFNIDLSGKVSVFHTFTGSPDGEWPASTMILASDGNLYGTTVGGGAYSWGLIYKVSTTSENTTAVYNFPPLVADDTNQLDANPQAGLMQGSDGNLYGVTSPDGTTGNGSLFTLTLSGSLVGFSPFDNAEGNNAYSAPIQTLDGDMYGTNFFGGESAPGGGLEAGSGAIYRRITNGSLSSIYSFSLRNSNGENVDGAGPTGKLVQSNDGNFYGTTYYGGKYGWGTIFELTPSGALTTLYDFGGDSSTGRYPTGNLLLASDGNYYGVTHYGGNYGRGTVFKINLKGTSGASNVLADVTVNPLKVLGGHIATGKVTLTSAAPEPGEAVTLVSNHPTDVIMPTTVIVPAGKTTAQFQIATGHVTSTTNATIWASAGGVTMTSPLEISFAIQLVAFNPPTVSGGHSFTTNVTLSGAAPSDLTIYFKSSNAAVVPVPASLVIPAGQTASSVKCISKKVTVSTAVNIEAYADTAGHLTEAVTVAP